MMSGIRSIHALSLTSHVRDWLLSSPKPRILHVFDSACNLINEQGVLSVVTKQIGDGPFNLVVDGDICFSDFLRAESAVSILGSQMIFGDLTINTADAKLWNPVPDWGNLHSMKDIIIRFLRKFEISSPGLRMAARIADCPSPVADLCSAIVDSDTPSALTCATRLAGLGAGLTPAGDDVLLGSIYAAWILHPANTAKTLAERIVETAAPLTTSLSAAWLRSAGRGEAAILWHELFDALCAGPITNPNYLVAVENAMDRILAVGETSGADALSGFIGTIATYAEKVNH